MSEVMWQYRWTNPGNDHVIEEDIAWHTVIPNYPQTMEERLAELASYEYAGKKIYELRMVQCVPVTHVVVPKEATDDMLRAFMAELSNEVVNIHEPEGWWEDIRQAYRDMIAAAP